MKKKEKRRKIRVGLIEEIKKAYSPDFALKEMEEGVKLYSRVFSWISGKFTVT